MRHKKLFAVVFFISFLAMFFIAGSLDQEYISPRQAAMASCVNFVVMGVSGFASGMLVKPGK